MALPQPARMGRQRSYRDKELGLNTTSRWSPVYRKRFSRPPLSPATFAPRAARMFSAEIVELPPLKLGSALSQLASALWMTPILFVRNSMNGGEIASPGSPNMLLCHGSRVAHSRIPLSVSQVSLNLSLNRTARRRRSRAVRSAPVSLVR